MPEDQWHDHLASTPEQPAVAPGAADREGCYRTENLGPRCRSCRRPFEAVVGAAGQPGRADRRNPEATVLPYDAQLLDGYQAGRPLSAGQWAAVTMPTLVMCGAGTSDSGQVSPVPEPGRQRWPVSRAPPAGGAPPRPARNAAWPARTLPPPPGVPSGPPALPTEWRAGALSRSPRSLLLVLVGRVALLLAAGHRPGRPVYLGALSHPGLREHGQGDDPSPRRDPVRDADARLLQRPREARRPSGSRSPAGRRGHEKRLEPRLCRRPTALPRAARLRGPAMLRRPGGSPAERARSACGHRRP